MLMVETKPCRTLLSRWRGAAVYCHGATSLVQQGAESHSSKRKGSVPSSKAQWAQARWVEQHWWQEQVLSTTQWSSYKSMVTKKDLRSTRDVLSTRQECQRTSWAEVYLQCSSGEYCGNETRWNGAPGPCAGRGCTELQNGRGWKGHLEMISFSH